MNINKDQLLTPPYYEYPGIFLNGFQDNATILSMNGCWNLCETNEFTKCAAISYNHSNNICYLYNSEFFDKNYFVKDDRFTTLMRKSKLVLIFINKYIYCIVFSNNFKRFLLELIKRFNNLLKNVEVIIALVNAFYYLNVLIYIQGLDLMQLKIVLKATSVTFKMIIILSV